MAKVSVLSGRRPYVPARRTMRWGMIWGGVDTGAGKSDLVGTVRITWQKLCRLELDGRNRLYFDTYSDFPAVYRMSVFAQDGSRHEYVGETGNLNQRFSKYRNPNTPQARRINKALCDFLSQGATIDVEKVQRAWIDIKGLDEELEFYHSDHRKCVEYFILTTTWAHDVRRLNR